MNKQKKGGRWFTALLLVALIVGNAYLLSHPDMLGADRGGDIVSDSVVADVPMPPPVTDADVPVVTPADMSVVTGGDAPVVTGTDIQHVSGADVSGADAVPEVSDAVVQPEREYSELQRSVMQMGISSGIQADGMSVNTVSAPAVELGISEAGVYCMDKYTIIPLKGEGLTWTSDNEEVATVNGNGVVTTKKAGKATITATDAAGNSDSCVINVIKVAYITIDDTPTEYTMQLLDTLDEYGVKATFFMNADPDEKDLYVEIYKRGHTFALHGYKHKTSYPTGEAFLDNMEKCRQFIMETTGCDSIDNVLRFPTGSKGHYNYRMILEFIQYRGYSAFDWTTEFHDYYYHSVDGCLEYFKTYLTHDRDVVLFHPRKWSVEALPQALDYIIENGYTMATITEDTAQYNFYKFYVDDQS